ncbi:MAG: hypothetical protein M3Z32_11435 [Acidobacteriota bacterium]|nr:hypothetical protein [Acidobacteriota bacterium]
MREADSLLEELKKVNQQLLAVHGPDLDEIAKAIERRGKLVTRMGHLLRDAASQLRPNRDALDQALEQALDTGDKAVQRILSLSTDHACTYLG